VRRSDATGDLADYREGMPLFDPADPKHEHALKRLRLEPIAWLTTVGADGQPASSPVWFVWNEADESFLIFSRPDTPKLRNIKTNPLVSLHLEGNSKGGDIVTLEGRAELLEGPPYDALPEAVDKYAANLRGMDYTAETFSADYSQTLRITPTRVRAW
jgi:PPOX class probable F420-dependent enzyme